MEAAGLNLVLFITAVLTTTASTLDSTCNTCNCQFNNIQVLDQLIDKRIASRINIGVTYVRWGRTTCPNVTGTQLVYSGRAGGTYWSVQGGGAEKLCLPKQPEYLPNTANIAQAIPSSPHVHGAEYEYSAGPNTNTFQHNVPCAVCYASARSSTLMIPAQIQCPSTWTREYYGYLSSERANEPSNRPSGHFRSSFNCVDVNPEVIENSGANGEGALFYYVLSACNSNGLSCPPYEEGRILSCVVCTK